MSRASSSIPGLFVCKLQTPSLEDQLHPSDPGPLPLGQLVGQPPICLIPRMWQTGLINVCFRTKIMVNLELVVTTTRCIQRETLSVLV